MFWGVIPVKGYHAFDFFITIQKYERALLKVKCFFLKLYVIFLFPWLNSKPDINSLADIWMFIGMIWFSGYTYCISQERCQA